MKNLKHMQEYEHFRNALTQITVSGGNYHGIGIIILDQAELLIGKFLFMQGNSSKEIFMDGISSSETTIQPMGMSSETNLKVMESLKQNRLQFLELLGKTY